MHSTLTSRGQVSMPAALRRQLNVKAGQILVWEKVSGEECRIRVVRQSYARADESMRGYMKRFHKGKALPKSTKGWMQLIREGEVK